MRKLITRHEPDSRERYDSYRNGDVETLTFERGETHLCYGEDSQGEIYDFCYIGENEMVHIDGKLSSSDIVSAQELIDGLGL